MYKKQVYNLQFTVYSLLGVVSLLAICHLPLTACAQTEAAAAATAAGTSNPPAGQASQATEQSNRISLDLKGVDIVDVLKLLSMKAGLNIVTGRNVVGRVTIFLKDVDVMDALDIILASNGLAYDRRGDIINVMTAADYEGIYGEKFYEKKKIVTIELKYQKAPQVAATLANMKSTVGKVIVDENSNIIILIDAPKKVDEMLEAIKQMDVELKTEIFSLDYAKADKLKDKIPDMLTKNIGKMSFDERSNKVLIMDTPKRLEEIIGMIKAFDAKSKEVLIDSKIIEVTLSDTTKTGIDWSAIFNNTNIKYFAPSADFDILESTDKGFRVTLGPLSGWTFQSLIEMLETYGETNILSCPRITAVDNQEAKILVGTTQPYVTKSISQSGTGTAVTAEDVKFVDVGVKLHVTPTINDKNFVTMKIRPEVSSISSYLETSEGNKIPVVDTSQAETVVTVKDGITVLLGGLMKNEYRDTVNKVPVLGSVPVLGQAFRNKSLQLTKKELIILLTPHIVTGERDIVPLGGVMPDSETYKIEIPREKNKKKM